MDPNRRGICKYYASTGRCRYGTRCRYLHSRYYQSKPLQYRPKAKTQSTRTAPTPSRALQPRQNNQKEAVFTWRINNIQYPLLFDGYIRAIKGLNVYISKDIVSLCMDFYLEYDLVELLKNLRKSHTFQSILFNIGPFEWKMNISMGYRFDLILFSIPEIPHKIHKLQFSCRVSLLEIGKQIESRWIILHAPRNEQTINSMIHYFTLDAIAPYNAFTYKLAIADLSVFDINGQDITSVFVKDQDELCKRASIWTTTEDQWLLRLISSRNRN